MTESNRRFSAALATTIVLIVIAALAAALAGCAVGPEYVKPATAVAPQFTGAQPVAAPAPPGRTPRRSSGRSSVIRRSISSSMRRSPRITTCASRWGA